MLLSEKAWVVFCYGLFQHLFQLVTQTIQFRPALAQHAVRTSMTEVSSGDTTWEALPRPQKAKRMASSS